MAAEKKPRKKKNVEETVEPVEAAATPVEETPTDEVAVEEAAVEEVAAEEVAMVEAAVEDVAAEEVAAEEAAIEEVVAEEVAVEEAAVEEVVAEKVVAEEVAVEEAVVEETAAEVSAEEPAAEVPAAPEAPVAKPAKKRLPRALRHKHAKRKREPASPRKPITRIPKLESELGRRQERRGVVVSDKGDKTIVVKVSVTKAHPKYKKVVRRTRKFHAHDEANSAAIGDTVRIVETRPLSKTKNWRLAEIVERAR